VDHNDDAATSDHRGGVNTRQRLGINGDVTEGAKFRVELGRGDGQFGKSVSGSGASSSSLQDEQNAILVNNVYLDIVNIYAGIDARLGRQYVGNPGDLVWNISPTDDNNLTFNAIDGLLLQHRHKYVQTDLFFGKMVENETRAGTNQSDLAGTLNNDVNLNSLDLVFPTIVPGGRINAGFLWGEGEDTSQTSDSNRLKTYRVGVNGGVMDNRLTYRAEWFGNDGSNKAPSGVETKYEGSAIDLGLGFNIPEGPGGSWGFNANWLMGSGDDNTSDNKDESFHDFSILGFNTSDRLMGDIFGRSNTLGGGTPLGQGLDSGAQGQGKEIINVGFWFGPKFCPRSTWMFNWYTFNTVEDGANSAGPQEDKFGDEIDLSWMWKHSENVNMVFGYAMLSPDNAITGTSPTAPDDDITQFSAKLNVKWGDKMGGGMQQIDPIAQ
jgi:hypothetical protein